MKNFLIKQKEKKAIYLNTKVDIETKLNEIFASIKVVQSINNYTNNPIELEIYINKEIDNIIFTSFEAKIGNSVLAKSKVIKTEKAEEKYSDSISSGNTSIFTTLDKYNHNKIIIHIGNIPPYEELTFISNYLKFTEYSNNSIQYEFFRYIPKLSYKETQTYIKGILEIKTKNKIININKKSLNKDIILKDEKYLEDNHKLLIKYEYNNNNSSNKIIFNLDNNNTNLMESIIYSQISPRNNNEQNLILLNHILKENKKENIEKDLIPGLFIILIDQSDSMSGNYIKEVSKELLLFLQSLPSGSYYQIIGFGAKLNIYDDVPKEYNQNNIEKSIKLIEAFEGNFGSSNIYEVLKFVYESKKNYDKITLIKNIFLLTNIEKGINNEKEILNLIEKNNNEYSLYSFGLGDKCDKKFIKKIGILGKGGYSFFKDIILKDEKYLEDNHKLLF